MSGCGYGAVLTSPVGELRLESCTEILATRDLIVIVTSHKSQTAFTFRGFACSAQILAILRCFHRRYKWAIQNTTLNEFALADFPPSRDRCPVDLTAGSACAEVHGRNTSDRGPDVSVEFCGLPVFAAACTSVSPKP